MQTSRALRTLLLVWETTLSVRALRITLSTVHLAAVAVLLSAVDLLCWSVLAWLTAGGLVADGWELRTAHLRLHHVLPVLGRLTLRLGGVLSGALSFLALAFFFSFALVLFLLLLRLPFFADFFELCLSQLVSACRANPSVW